MLLLTTLQNEDHKTRLFSKFSIEDVPYCLVERQSAKRNIETMQLDRFSNHSFLRNIFWTNLWFFRFIQKHPITWEKLWKFSEKQQIVSVTWQKMGSEKNSVCRKNLCFVENLLFFCLKGNIGYKYLHFWEKLVVRKLETATCGLPIRDDTWNKYFC